MKKELKDAIEKYQCPGCVVGGDLSCYEPHKHDGIGCGKHCAGSIIMGVGRFWPGMPTGFDRIGECSTLKPIIYNTFESSKWQYNMWNIPVWKYLSKEGHTFVRGIMPRVNSPFVHIFLEDCIGKINCLEIMQDNVDEMD